ncbi:hypothetical protein JMJ35_007971 [Cladonia borealis]|uniref:Uncharacterized protein n=1 Tax=Cladonia borealis TaxID=184061 RepID=A0AA39UZC8_9LECA|nr:hypothetical protein JMJ35_007971 [Cladonia borealis]
MPAFWNSWALWEKLVFCLGSAIVIVIMLGCVKLLWNQWRLRKYVAIAATKATLKQNMQHSQSVRRGRAREVPFGVRALESGIEVEGVWVSGTNTPTGSTPGTPPFLANANPARGEPSPDRASSASTMSHLEMPQPTRGYPTVMIASDNNSQDSGPFADLRVSSDSTKQQPPISDHLPHKRPSYKPRRSSQLRYSNLIKFEDLETLVACESHWLTHHGEGKKRQGFESEYEEQNHSVSEGSGSSNGEYHETSYQPSRSQRPCDEFLHPVYPDLSKDSRPATYELSDIETRGSSAHETHFNEQGHLSVRSRHHGVTEGGQHGSQNETNSPPSKGKDPFATPPRRPSDEGVPVFHIDDDSTDYPLMTHDGTTEHPVNAQPLVPVDASRKPRPSQIVRKVNSGFQILAPGTFDVPLQDNAGRKEDVPGNKRHSRRLQKRSRRNSYSIEES